MPQGVKEQPHRERERQREHDPLARERKRRNPVVQRRAGEAGIGVQGEVRGLMEQAAVQRVDRALQLLHGRDQRADDDALGLEFRIAAAQVILNELPDVDDI